jgi:Leucine-rich repeat (LRR) protein
LPEEIGQLAELEVLDLTGNALASTPASFAKLKKMRRLNLQGNMLQKLPEEIAEMTYECCFIVLTNC